MEPRVLPGEQGAVRRDPLIDDRRLARLSLGLSVLAGVGALAYLAAQGRPPPGAGVGAVVVAAGAWEYRRKLADVRAAERFDRRRKM